MGNDENPQRPLLREYGIINKGKSTKTPSTKTDYNQWGKMHEDPFHQSTLKQMREMHEDLFNKSTV